MRALRRSRPWRRRCLWRPELCHCHGCNPWQGEGLAVSHCRRQNLRQCHSGGGTEVAEVPTYARRSPPGAMLTVGRGPLSSPTNGRDFGSAPNVPSAGRGRRSGFPAELRRTKLRAASRAVRCRPGISRGSASFPPLRAVRLASPPFLSPGSPQPHHRSAASRRRRRDAWREPGPVRPPWTVG